jgi:hypothetical protein
MSRADAFTSAPKLGRCTDYAFWWNVLRRVDVLDDLEALDDDPPFLTILASSIAFVQDKSKPGTFCCLRTA